MILYCNDDNKRKLIWIVFSLLADPYKNALVLHITNNSTTVLPNKYTQYLQQKLLLRRELCTSALYLDERDGKDPNRPIPDPGEQILSNQEDLDVLAKLRKLLKIFYRRLLNADKKVD